MRRTFFVFLVAMLACNEPPPAPAPFQIFVRVESEGKPVPAAIVTRLGTAFATDANGRVLLAIPGEQNEIAEVSVRCPDGLQSPPRPVSVRLQRLPEKGKVPEYSVVCPAALRKVVVAVRAENGPNLPVVYQSRAVTRTDASGAAHFALEVGPGAQFIVALDTHERKDLRPENPSRLFTVGPRDEVFLLDQPFAVSASAASAASDAGKKP